jgi:hypothetical protein
VVFSLYDCGFFKWEIGLMGYCFFSWSYKSFMRAVSSILLWWDIYETSFSFFPNVFVWYYLWYFAILASLRACFCAAMDYSIIPVPLSSSSIITSYGGSMLMPKYCAAAAWELSVKELLMPGGNIYFLLTLIDVISFTTSFLTSSMIYLSSRRATGG